MASDWPFTDPQNTAVITLTRVVDGAKPILYVVHDEEGDWQFLDGGEVAEEDAAVASLKEMLKLDASLKQLADLPVGWAAERATAEEQWQRYER